MVAKMSSNCRQEMADCEAMEENEFVAPAPLAESAVTAEEARVQEPMRAEPSAPTPLVAHVRFHEGDDHLRLQLRLGDDRKSFFRPVDEKLDKIRYRLQLLASAGLGTTGASPQPRKKHTDKRFRHAQASRGQGGKRRPFVPSTPPSNVSVRFFTSERGEEELLPRGITIGDALAKVERIVIGDVAYVVRRNEPVVVSLSVMDPVLVGIPIVPMAETEFCEPDDCHWRWYRAAGGPKDSDTLSMEKPIESNQAAPLLVSNHRLYTPSSDDIGARLRIVCVAPSSQPTPDDATPPEMLATSAETTTAVVIDGPSRERFTARRRLGATTTTSPCFRVMSYNVLFDGYASTAHARANLFPYVAPEVLRESYRMQLVFLELQEAHADVICLQEMGEAVFHRFFAPMMTVIGFHGVYTGKTGTTHEGCAIFVRRSRFDVEEEHVLDLSVATRFSTDPAISALMTTYPEFACALERIPSIAQILVLRDRRDDPLHGGRRRLILANTHLFYRDDADMIRLLQSVAIVRELERITASMPEDQAGVLLCGDLNALPNTAAVKFLLDGVVDDSHAHWRDAKSFRWKQRDDAAIGKASTTSGGSLPSCSSVRHPLDLASACGIPAFTNYSPFFTGTLDYILFGAPALRLNCMFPLFQESDVRSDDEVALPSSVFPSDHVSLIADLAWTSSTTTTSVRQEQKEDRDQTVNSAALSLDRR